MMLNADVRKGGGELVKCGHLRTGGMKRGHFLWTSFMDDPFWHLQLSTDPCSLLPSGVLLRYLLRGVNFVYDV